MSACTCGSDEAFGSCCGPVIDGSRPAETAEALMRARYTAYATGKIDFLKQSLHPDHRDDFDSESASQWSENATWQGLDVIGSEDGDDGNTATVEFVARYAMDNKDQRHHERATFERVDDAWTFVEGELVAAKPYVRETPKIGRNDPCSCGSGKKFKKCCG